MIKKVAAEMVTGLLVMFMLIIPFFTTLVILVPLPENNVTPLIVLPVFIFTLLTILCTEISIIKSFIPKLFNRLFC